MSAATPGIIYIVLEIEMLLLELPIQWRQRENSAAASAMLLQKFRWIGLLQDYICSLLFKASNSHGGQFHYIVILSDALPTCVINGAGISGCRRKKGHTYHTIKQKINKYINKNHGILIMHPLQVPRSPINCLIQNSVDITAVTMENQLS